MTISDYEIKRNVATFVPYRRRGDTWEFFLQKRTMDAPTNPGKIGLFGGGVEGNETPEECMYREVKEELSYRPVRVRFFETRLYPWGTRHVFIEEASADFDQSITVREGEYGRFFTLSELQKVEERTDGVKSLIPDLATKLNEK